MTDPDHTARFIGQSSALVCAIEALGTIDMILKPQKPTSSRSPPPPQRGPARRGDHHRDRYAAQHGEQLDRIEAGEPWYHGSPFELTTIREGSTITRKRALARVFSHKPTLVSVSDDGQVKHNGTLSGYLYIISDAVQPGDVTPHPHTTMTPGDEWLTTRELRVQLLCSTEPVPEEQLTDTELAALQRQLDGQSGRC